MGFQKKEGCISGCEENSKMCKYRCCDQSAVTSEDFCPENSILLYPGEWEAEAEERRQHILISDMDYHGGKLGYCDRANFDQSKCDQNPNFKPMDCKSYPFFPVLIDGEVQLAIDHARCPLSKSMLELRQHYLIILSEWQRIADTNDLVRKWIQNITLDGYKIIDKF